MVLLVSDFDLLHHFIDLEESNGKRGNTHPSNISRAICGSCNGLLVLIIDPYFFLWNPLTGYFKKVLSYGNLYDHRISGLCYDSSTDDYQIVMVLVKHVGTPGGYGYESVLVGSLKGKSWTHVDCSSYIITSFEPGPIVNERLHWKVREKKKSEYSQIVYFNPQMRTFTKVPMPQPKHSVDGDIIYGLGVMDGCLCMSRLDNQSDGERYHIEVLAMKEYGMEKSWTLMFVVSNFWPFGFTKNGKALALKVAPHQEGMGIWVISVYNPMDNSIRDIPVPTPLSTFDNGVYAQTYEESLVKPTDYYWEDEELRGEATYVEYFLGGACRKMKRHTYWFEQPAPEEQPMSGWGYGW